MNSSMRYVLRRLGALGALGVLSLVQSPSAWAWDIVEEFDQAEARDAEGRITVEESIIYVIACSGPSENGGQYYLYEYVNRDGYRAILPPDWGQPIGGRDFDTMDEAGAAACTTGVTPTGPPPVPGPPLDGGGAKNATAWRGQIGQRVEVTCEPQFPLRSVWGDDVYTDDTDICSAAVHAGAISRASGGRVVIEVRPGQSRYGASTRNGITSGEWGEWTGSFAVVSEEP